MDNDPDFSWRPLDAADEQPAQPEPEQASMPTQHAAPAPAPAPEPVAQSRPDSAPMPATTYGAAASVPAPAAAPPADNYDDFEADDVPPPKGRGPASTRYLGVAFLAAITFLFGVLAQKHHDAGFSPPAKGLAALAGAAGGGAGAHAGAGGAAGAGAAAAGGGSGAAAGEGGAGRTPALVGTLVKVSGSDVVVKDATGTDHVIHTTDRTRVSKQMNLTDLSDGSTVSVFGTTDQAGGLNASSVTQQNSSANRLGNGGPATNPTSAPSTSGSSAGTPGNGAVSGQS